MKIGTLATYAVRLPVVLAVLLLAACGGGASAPTGDAETTGKSNWDSLNWDKGNWS